MQTRFLFKSLWCGVVPYQQGLDLQNKWVDKIKSQSDCAAVLGMEHKPVITLGVRGNEFEDIHVSQQELQQRGYEIKKIRRGGQATIHNLGQLVIYPLLPLRNWGLGTKKYVTILMHVTEQVISQSGLSCYQGLHEPGLYTPNGKIAFFGLRINQGVSSHGVAINVRNDLSAFDQIKSCGSLHQPMDSLSKQGVEMELDFLFHLWCDFFRKSLDDCL